LDTDTVIYNTIGNIEKPNSMTSLLTQYISDSYNNLSIKDQSYLLLKMKTQLKYVMNNTFIKNCMPQIVDVLMNMHNLDESDESYMPTEDDKSSEGNLLCTHEMTDEEILDAISSLNLNTIDFSTEPVSKVFKTEYYRVHFKNGYINLRDMSFHQRQIGVDYVNHYIKRDYKKSSVAQRGALLKVFKKVYPLQEDMNAMFEIFGYALTGKATAEQMCLFLLGAGSSGKSTIMKLTELAFKEYFVELGSDALAMSNTNPDKTFSTFYYKPQYRIIWINEPEDGKMNASTFKNVVEGRLKGKLLFKDEVHEFHHHGQIIITTNDMINIKLDSGTDRRILGYEHKSLFTSMLEMINGIDNVYKTEKDLELKLASLGLLDAWVDILCGYAKQKIKGNSYPLPQSFKDCTTNIKQANDKFQDLIDAKLIITNNINDKIGKNAMLALYTDYTRGHLTTHQLISSLKMKKIKYEKDMRSEGVKGCFVGIKLKPYDYDYDKEEELEEEKESVSEQLLSAQQRIKELEYLLEQHNITEDDEDVIKPIKKKQQSISLNVNIDNDEDDYTLYLNMKLKRGDNPMDSDNEDEEEPVKVSSTKTLTKKAITKKVKSNIEYLFK
jgi:hypothetical protein